MFWAPAPNGCRSTVSQRAGKAAAPTGRTKEITLRDDRAKKKRERFSLVLLCSEANSSTLHRAVPFFIIVPFTVFTRPVTAQQRLNTEDTLLNKSQPSNTINVSERKSVGRPSVEGFRRSYGDVQTHRGRNKKQNPKGRGGFCCRTERL